MKKLKWILLAPMCAMTTICCLPMVACSNNIEIIKHKGISVQTSKFEKGKDFTITYSLEEGYEFRDDLVNIKLDNDLLPFYGGCCWSEKNRTITIFSEWTNCNHITIDLIASKESTTRIRLDPSFLKTIEVEYKSTSVDIPLITSDGTTINDVVVIVGPDSWYGNVFLDCQLRVEHMITAPCTFSLLYEMADDDHPSRCNVGFSITFASKDLSVIYGYDYLKLVCK